MYESYFGLSKLPFRLTPDPAFFYPGPQYKRALSYLEYGLIQGEGFSVVVGESGLGKSLLVETVLATTTLPSINVIRVPGHDYGPRQFLLAVAASMKIDGIDANSAYPTLFVNIQLYLQEKTESGQQTLLILDNAHRIPDETLVSLGELLDLHFNSQPVVLAFLLGSQQLSKKLDGQELSTLCQFMQSRTELKRLTPLTTREYLEHRLTIAQWRSKPRIEEIASALIHKLSGGIPRNINMLVDKLLLDSFLGGRSAIRVDDVKRVHEEVSSSRGHSATINSDVAPAGSRSLKSVFTDYKDKSDPQKESNSSDKGDAA